MAARLEFTDRGTELVTEEGLRLFLDFVGDRAHYQKPHRGKSELIAKAVGLPKGHKQVWDMTAGLCEDAWFLVRLGAKVTAFERNPLVAGLVEDARKRARENPQTASLAQCLTLKQADGIEVLRAIADGQGP